MKQPWPELDANATDHPAGQRDEQCPRCGTGAGWQTRPSQGSSRCGTSKRPHPVC